ncbi:methylated-DNA--[protein]-cysteine S-methyltransferase [Acidithiobacillus sp.]|uniref:methylated-DNA--[protein]-cysteine S-methyltransferase n=1 Tax=Acidithiobacillus sp. TaxID=1872118 RepID=UPI0025C44A05|nr:methylated-DNA--[protein]-cysteine S-methyltransferase [Acidithiobacillus sp.]
MDTSPGIPGAASTLNAYHWQPGWGWIEAQFQDGALIRLAFADAPSLADPSLPSVIPAPASLRELLDAYFSGRPIAARDALQCLPIRLQGTPFQKRVWAALTEIPYGKTTQYGLLAQSLGSAPRAVGQACKANPVAILVPCHRVLAATGLGGYGGLRSGPAWSRKEALLHLEGAL